jgi:hypothetical protein
MVTVHLPQGASHEAVVRTAIGILWIGFNQENWAATNPRSETGELPGRFSQGQPPPPNGRGGCGGKRIRSRWFSPKLDYPLDVV